MKRKTGLQWVDIHEKITAIILPLKKYLEAFCFRNFADKHTYRLPLSAGFRFSCIIYFTVGKFIFMFG